MADESKKKLSNIVKKAVDEGLSLVSGKYGTAAGHPSMDTDKSDKDRAASAIWAPEGESAPQQVVATLKEAADLPAGTLVSTADGECLQKNPEGLWIGPGTLEGRSADKLPLPLKVIQ